VVPDEVLELCLVHGGEVPNGADVFHVATPAKVANAFLGAVVHAELGQAGSPALFKDVGGLGGWVQGLCISRFL
jgi:hypothetical protein